MWAGWTGVDRLGECYFRHAQICGILQANLHVMYRQQCHIVALTPASTAPSTHHARTHTYTHTHTHTHIHTHRLQHTLHCSGCSCLMWGGTGCTNGRPWVPCSTWADWATWTSKGTGSALWKGTQQRYVHACTWNLLCVSVCCIHHTLAGTLVCSVWLHTLHWCMCVHTQHTSYLYIHPLYVLVIHTCMYIHPLYVHTPPICTYTPYMYIITPCMYLYTPYYVYIHTPQMCILCTHTVHTHAHTV